MHICTAASCRDRLVTGLMLEAAEASAAVGGIPASRMKRRKVVDWSAVGRWQSGDSDSGHGGGQCFCAEGPGQDRT